MNKTSKKITPSPLDDDSKISFDGHMQDAEVYVFVDKRLWKIESNDGPHVILRMKRQEKND